VVGKGRNLYCMVVRKEKGSLFFSSKTNKAKKSSKNQDQDTEQHPLSSLLWGLLLELPFPLPVCSESSSAESALLANLSLLVSLLLLLKRSCLEEKTW